MPKVDTSRLVEISLPLKNGEYELCTGYTITDDLVLTVAHAFIKHGYNVSNSPKTEIRFKNEDWEEHKLIWLEKNEYIDAALIKLSKKRNFYKPLKLAKCKDIQAEWSGGGFPIAGKIVDSSEKVKYQDSVGVNGKVQAFGGQKNEYLELTVEGETKDPELWKGLSGGPVIIDGFFAGILRNVPEAFDGKRLHATSVSRLIENKEFFKLTGNPELEEIKEHLDENHSLQTLTKVIRAFHPDAKLPDDLRELAGIYRSVIKDKKALIILDNAFDAAQIRDMLPVLPCGFIVTSRHKIVSIPDLKSFDLNILSKEESCELLTKVIDSKKATKDDLEKIAKLCGYLPLALRVAGSFIKAHPARTIEDYIKLLSDERERLKKLKVDDLDVDTVLRLSLDQVKQERPEVIEHFEMLSVFPESFDKEAALKVCEKKTGEIDDCMDVFIEYSLLLYNEKDNRFRMHDLMRDVVKKFVFEDLGQAKAEKLLNTASLNHAKNYESVLRNANELYSKGGDAIMQGLNLFDKEWKNIQTGHVWAEVHSEKDEVTAKLCNDYPDAGYLIFNFRQHPKESIHWLESALKAARRLKLRNFEGSHLGNMGLAYYSLGEYKKAIEFQEQLLEIAKEIGYRLGEGAALGNLGIAYHSLGEYKKAIEFHKQHLDISKEIGDRLGEGQSLGNLGSAYYSLGEYKKAIEFQEQRLEIAKEIGDRLGEGQSLGNLGIAYYSLGEYKKAIEFHKQSLEIAKEIGDRLGESNALGNLGVDYYSLGEYKKAIEFYTQRLEIAKEIGY
ncbi:tetratricopeptide repeat protein, partial [Candidatus Desantisbacteria bacterium]|nr:tetratricopeptide repeat protein [Candidatus Desantisbacteria bacterium]